MNNSVRNFAMYPDHYGNVEEIYDKASGIHIALSQIDA